MRVAGVVVGETLELIRGQVSDGVTTIDLDKAAEQYIRSRGATPDRKSTRLNSSHAEIYTLSLHDALPICGGDAGAHPWPGERRCDDPRPRQGSRAVHPQPGCHPLLSRLPRLRMYRSEEQ